MIAKTYRPQALHLLPFTENAATLEGRWPLASLPRLVQDTPAVAGEADAADGGAEVLWSAQGERRPVTGGTSQTWLHVQAQTRVHLVCQRCLQVMEQHLHADRSFMFVRDEAEALRLDEESDDDVLALPPQGRLDLQALIEDELILALPIVPRHDACPDPLPMPSEDPEDAPSDHPFKALAALKRTSK